jgi:hypothetical protein
VALRRSAAGTVARGMDSNILLIVALLRALLALSSACYHVGVALVGWLLTKNRKPAPRVTYRLARAASLRATSDQMQKEEGRG